MDSASFDRRRFFQSTSLTTAAALAMKSTAQSEDTTDVRPTIESRTKIAYPHSFLTPAEDFYTVARGEPKPHALTGQSLIDAGMTVESWRLEITADPYIEPPLITQAASIHRSFTIAEGTAIDLPMLKELGKKHAVKFVKAMQCLNLAAPLGQGLWEGVPLREVLRLCGALKNVRRIYFWGYHNHDPKQVFKSSVNYTQAMETAPGDLPVILAYKLNGQPISPLRGGPVRMIIPWSHGFKNIKWLNHIFITNDPRIPETYFVGNANNDPDGSLKSAAYVDKGDEKIESGSAVTVSGHVIAGPSGIRRVEYWLRTVIGEPKPMADDAPELLNGPWKPCEILPPPDWSEALPEGVSSRELIGFDPETGKPNTWPLRFGFASWSITLHDLQPGVYEFRARSVDMNDFAQPEPRPYRKNGNNLIQVRRFEVT